MGILNVTWRVLLSVLLGLCLASPGVHAAPRIVALLSQDLPPYQEALKGFGEVVGAEASIEVLYLDGDGKAPEAGGKKGEGGAELVFAIGSRAASEARRTMPSLPLVAGMILNEDELPGPNGPTTGVVLQHPLKVHFNYLRRLLPEARRVGVIYNSEENEKVVAQAVKVAAGQGFELVTHKVTNPQGIPGALESLSRRAEVIWTVQDPLLLNVNTASGVLLFSFRNRIPLVGLSPSWVKAGALYSLGWDYRDIGRQCGEMALGVLKTAGRGSVPPPEPPRRVAYSLNMKTAGRMKLKIPESLVREAEEVFR